MQLSELAGVGRTPQLPLTVTLADAAGSANLQLLTLLRVLPGQRYVGAGVWRGRPVLAKLLVGGKKTIDLDDVHPTQEVRVACGVWASITGHPDHAFVHSIDDVNRALGFGCRPERGGSKKICGALQSAPRVIAIVRVLRNTRHGKWVQ